MEYWEILSERWLKELMELKRTNLEPSDINRVTSNFILKKDETRVKVIIEKDVTEDQYLQSFDRGYDFPPTTKFVKKSTLLRDTDLLELTIDIYSHNIIDVDVFIIQYGLEKRLSNDHKQMSLRLGNNHVKFVVSRHNQAVSYKMRLKFGKRPCSFTINEMVLSQKSGMDFEDRELERLARTRQQLLTLKPKTVETISQALMYSNTRNIIKVDEEDTCGYEYLISVIVPVYNTAPYLHQCLTSLLDQTIEGIEIIAINDGSTDDSLKVLNDIAQQNPGRIKVFDQVNRGLGAVRNRGIELAKGRYIMFLDSDDSYTTDACEKLFYYAKKYNSDIVIGRIGWDDNGKIIPQDNIDKKLGRYLDRRFANLRNDSGTVFVNVVCSIYSSRLIKENDIRFPEGTYWEDMPFSLQTWYHSKQIGYISDIIYLRTKREGSITQTYNFKTLNDRIKIAEIIDGLMMKYKLHNLYNYFSWTIDDVEKRIELIASEADKAKAQSIWVEAKPKIISMKEKHERFYSNRNKLRYQIFK